MKNKQISMIDILLETHIGLERQGPGSPEMTIRALSFLDNIDHISKAADLGCGTGGQTMVLAQNIKSTTDMSSIPVKKYEKRGLNVTRNNIIHMFDLFLKIGYNKIVSNISRKEFC